MKAHKVNTKHPKYRVSTYDRGNGQYWGLIPSDKVDFPLDDPEGAERSLDQFEEQWEGATPYERHRMTQHLKQNTIQSQSLLKGRQITDPDEQMKIYQSHQLYLNAYTAYSARIETDSD